MGFVPELKHWANRDAERACCRETEHQCYTIMSLTAHRLSQRGSEHIINFTSDLLKHNVPLFENKRNSILN